MLEPNFELPDKQLSIDETSKRLKLLDWFKDYIKPSVTGLTVSGSLSYGQNHSVKQTSDIDMQLLVNSRSTKELEKTDCFDEEELSRALDGYRKGIYKQFSLVFRKDNVPMECHFWDEQAFIDAITYKNENTPRLRSGVETPSTDFGYSFDREEDIRDYYGEIVQGFAVADFPSYRRINGKLFLCRPITNILAVPLIAITNQRLNQAIDECWALSVQELLQYCGDKPLNLEDTDIANTLPGKNKMCDEALSIVKSKTEEEIEKQRIN